MRLIIRFMNGLGRESKRFLRYKAFYQVNGVDQAPGDTRLLSLIQNRF